MKTRTAVLLALGCIAGAFVLESMLMEEPKRSPKRQRRDTREHDNEKIDVSSDDSFPASDPPPWSSSVASRH